MDKLANKLGLLCVVLVLFAPGCGKKDEKKADGKGYSKVAHAGKDIPLLAEDLLEDDNISSFAFVDDEGIGADNKQTLASNEDTIVSKDIEIDAESMETEDGQVEPYSFKTVYFDFNKNSIRDDQKTVVAQDIKVAMDAADQGKDVVVEGHCDQVGSAAYNLALSQRRAESVKQEMILAGISADKVKTLGYGYERPVVWSDQQDRAQLIRELQPNRRAEIITN